ncbi:hypothetical protein ACFRFH_12000 [Leifsonia sp. NPDC056824]|uniref:hypothetical protein n=1 Tax=Leifsonia sp. NPDC056824 TaxID=3345953 RepID=UPI0036B8FBC8
MSRRDLVGSAQMLRRLVRAYARRFESEGDEPEFASLFGLHAEIEAALVVMADVLRSRDQSWAVIGKSVGMTGEGARKRWNRKESA